jgi:hypothetical protein
VRELRLDHDPPRRLLLLRQLRHDDGLRIDEEAIRMDALVRVHLPIDAPRETAYSFRVIAESLDDYLPVDGMEVLVSLDGDGTLDSGQVVTSKKLKANEAGESFFEWWEFPRYMPRRELTSTVAVSWDDPGIRIRIEEMFRLAL